MDLMDLTILYLVAGAGCAVAAVAAGRAGDALLLLPLWPLYGPFVLSRGPTARPADARPASGPLDVLLPDAEMVAALGRRTTESRQRIAEIAEVLARPEFREADAAARVAELEAAVAAPTTLASARSRLDNIRRLAGLKRRLEEELEQISELSMQLKTQAEVIRLVGTQPAGMRELASELSARVEGLDQMLAEELELDDADVHRSETRG